MGNFLFALLILACAMMMIWMMRGMHGRHDGNAVDDGRDTHRGFRPGNLDDGTESAASVDDLRRRRDELDRQINEREAREQAAIGGDPQ